MTTEQDMKKKKKRKTKSKDTTGNNRPQDDNVIQKPSSRQRYEEARQQRKDTSSSRNNKDPPQDATSSNATSLRHDSSRRRYMESKQQRRANKSTATMEDHHPVAKDTNDNAVYPGAVRVAGDGPALYPEDDEDDTSWSVSNEPQEPLREDKALQQEEEPTLLQAELVHPKDDDKNDNVPYASKAVPVKPWKQRLMIVAIILVVVGITVGVVVPLTSNGGSSNDATISAMPSTSPAPSVIPTTTMAPTSFELTTIVLQLDSKPEETGWKLDCNGVNVANIPSGVYRELENRLVTAQFPVQLGQACVFTILDSGQDGLMENGFFRVHFGSVYSTPATSLVDGRGMDFTSQQEVEFTMEAPPATNAPSSLPSVVPTSVPSLVPSMATAQPSVIRTGTQSPSVTEPPVMNNPPPPTQAPMFVPIGTPEPSQAPIGPTPIGSSMAPSLEPRPETLVDVYGEIMFDFLPSETGFSLTCNGIVLQEARAQTFGNPNTLHTFVVTAFVGDTCTFVITDSFGDGICCALEPNGFYRLFHGSVPSSLQNLIAEGGEFGFQDQVDFVAREPIF